MKTITTLLTIVFLIVGVAVPAWGDLFSTTASVSFTQIEVEGATAPFNYTISGQLISISFDGEADLGVRPGVGISYGNMNGDGFTTVYPRIEWGFQIYDYIFRISEGYQIYVLTINSPVPVSYSYAGSALGISWRWKVSEMLTLTGMVQIPQSGGFYRDHQIISFTENPAASSYCYGAKITVLPLITFTFDYSYSGFGNDSSPFQMVNQGCSLGVVLRW